MFKLKKSRTFMWPVTVTVPDNGKHSRSTFTAEFRELPREELLAHLEGFKDPDASTIEQARRLSDFLGTVLIAVDGVQYETDAGERETDQREIIEALIADTRCAGPLFDAYIEGTAGKARKN